MRGACGKEAGGRVHGLEVDGRGAGAAGDEAFLYLEGVLEFAWGELYV